MKMPEIGQVFVNRIPEELKALPQWVGWKWITGRNGKPTKLLIDPKVFCNTPANSVDPSTWGTFAQACYGLDYDHGIGFILTENDPYVIVDIDFHERTELTDDQKKFLDRSQGYVEISPRGGYHIVMRGSIKSAVKRDECEIYSRGRYMTFTGNIAREGEIIEQQEYLDELWTLLKGNDVFTEFVDDPEIEDDETIIARMLDASNGEYVSRIANGDWAEFHPSESEVDFALFDVIAHYTRNRNQVVRVFMGTPYGQQRTKLKARPDLIEKILARAYDNQPATVDMDQLAMMQKAVQSMIAAKYAEPVKAAPSVPMPIGVSVGTSEVSAAVEAVYTPPPGLMGRIAQFYYDKSPRPVPEIALAGAIGFMAGLCGRAWNVSGTGLNQYVMLLADTGTGKDILSRGTDSLFDALLPTVPMSADYRGPGHIMSSQALVKELSEKPSIISVIGEVSAMLNAMTNPRADQNQRMLYAAYLALWSASGKGSTLPPMVYSDRAKNTATVRAPAFSLLGESNPHQFYEVVDESTISSGLLPRMIIIEYEGDRKYLNRDAFNVQPSDMLLRDIGGMLSQAIAMNSSHNAINIPCDASGQELLDSLEYRYTDLINQNKNNQVAKELWNRAQLKIWKLAGLVAVGCNYFHPVIMREHIEWSQRIIEHTTNKLIAKFDKGEVGLNSEESKQRLDMERDIIAFLRSTADDMHRKYKVQPKMFAAGVIPMSYFNEKTGRLASFKNDKRKATFAITSMLKVLSDEGKLIPISKNQMLEHYNVSTFGYAINPEQFKM